MLRKCSVHTLTVLWKPSPPRQPGEAGGGLQRVSAPQPWPLAAQSPAEHARSFSAPDAKLGFADPQLTPSASLTPADAIAHWCRLRPSGFLLSYLCPLLFSSLPRSCFATPSAHCPTQVQLWLGLNPCTLQDSSSDLFFSLGSILPR